MIDYAVMLGASFEDEERAGIMHVWRYTAYVMGVSESVLFRTQADALRLFQVAKACEPRPDCDAVAMAHGLIGGAPMVVGVFEPRKQKKMADYIFCVSRELLGDATAESLRFPPAGCFLCSPGYAPRPSSDDQCAGSSRRGPRRAPQDPFSTFSKPRISATGRSPTACPTMSGRHGRRGGELHACHSPSGAVLPGAARAKEEAGRACRPTPVPYGVEESLMTASHYVQPVLGGPLPCLVPFLLACLLAAAPAEAGNGTPEEIGLAIAQEARDRIGGFGDFTARQVMVLRNRQGQESGRQLRVRVLEMPDDGDKSLFVFDDPRDVRGTAFLVHAHRMGADDQWLYLPALRRVKRISSANRSGSFMGSEFAYEDMTPRKWRSSPPGTCVTSRAAMRCAPSPNGSP